MPFDCVAVAGSGIEYQLIAAAAGKDHAFERSRSVSIFTGDARVVMIRSLCVVAGLTAACVANTPAVAAPQQLYNKTVTLSWSTQSIMRGPDGKEKPASANIRYVIYISSQGRLFEHSSRSAGGRTQGGDQGLSATKTKMGEARGLGFEGNRLVANRGYAGAGGSGAMRAVATFDSSFSSCTLAVTHGKEGGAPLKRKGINGQVVELSSLTVSSPSCSVQSGNALAN